MVELYSISYYFLIAVVLIIGIIIYLKIAEKWSITDQPNSRSSHIVVTKRGGGIIYVIAMVIYMISSNLNMPNIIICGLLLGIMGFIDDLKNLDFKIKLIFQCLTIGYLLSTTNYNALEWYLLFLMFFLIISSINILNFMDGINGLTILYSFSFLISFYIINVHMIAFTDSNFLLIIILSNLIIGYFNIRIKAVCFLGDVGAITMGFIYAVLTISLMVKTNSLSPLILFLVYFLDSGWTIVERWIAKENIFLPHRKHLYQLLVNEYKLSHLLVAAIYFSIQSLVNLIWLMNYEKDLAPITLISIFGVFSVIYLLIKKILNKKLDLA
jgi:UDP-N-acetylmuramyl pentapeptide phosphotransferase/UDP-N-acetylglucosamine-1-phosphate transferase